MTGVYTGKIVDIDNFSEKDINVMDIAVSLSRQRRYAGHTLVPWSVGQHLILCGMICENLQLDEDVRTGALLHDVSETWLQDVIHPIKSVYTNSRYKKDTDRLDRIVFEHFNALHVFKDKEIMRKVKIIDQLACHWEMSQLTNWTSYISQEPQSDHEMSVEHDGKVYGELFLANSKLDSMGFYIPGDLVNMPECNSDNGNDVLQHLLQIYTVMEQVA